MAISTRASAKAVFWSNHVSAWQASGLRQKDYCDQQGLHIKSFARWKSMFTRNPGLSSTMPATTSVSNTVPLIPLSIVPEIPFSGALVQEQPPASGIRLHVQNRYVIDLAPDFHEPTLHKLLGVLR